MWAMCSLWLMVRSADEACNRFKTKRGWQLPIMGRDCLVESNNKTACQTSEQCVFHQSEPSFSNWFFRRQIYGDVVYQYKCQVPDCTGTNTGETARNLYNRALEHQENYLKYKNKSFINAHQVEKHQNQPPDFQVKVLQSYRDPLSRQTAESVYITRTQGEILNSKSEFFNHQS